MSLIIYAPRHEPIRCQAEEEGGTYSVEQLSPLEGAHSKNRSNLLIYEI
jgi:hypothetical protein